ncbi:MAG TPA: type II toxin-antitoxin system Phd/YefM family antitoxin [Polyangiaceae bacterium]
MRARKWQLQDAKNRLSEVVESALTGGPQVITRRGKDAVVVVSMQHYERLTRPAGRLIDLLRRAPRVRGGLARERDPDVGRDVDL